MTSLIRHPNGHDAHPNSGSATATCPYCGQNVSRREYKEIQARIELEERARIAKVETDLKARVAREVAKAETQAKNAVEKAKRDAARAAELQIRSLKASQEEQIGQRLAAQRETLARQTAEAVNAERAKHFDDKLKLESQLADMQRRLQAKTAHQLGEPAEVDLFEGLVSAFPADRISRIVKGVRGPDVLVEVLDHGEVVGKIVLDSKNHSRWSNKFTSKLRNDQLAEGADFAVLSTTTFPSGVRELHLQGGVIVASPQRVVVLVALLRQQIVQNHVFKRGAESRNEKAERLYDFLLSPAGDEMFDRLLRTTRALESLDAAEVKSHQTNWAKRAELLREIAAVREQFCDMLSEIIGGGR